MSVRLLFCMTVLAVDWCGVCGVDFLDCPRLRYKNQGYTYTIDRNTRQKVWSFCHFPNPKFDHELCGMSEIDGHHYLCDPENMLNTTEAISVDSKLQSIVSDESKSALCVNSDDREENVVVVVVLVGNIRVPDLSSDPCVNDCGEIYPTLDTISRAPASQELDIAMATFADNLRVRLSLGHCDNEVMVLYSSNYNRVYTSVGRTAGSLVSQADIQQVNTKFLSELTSSRNLTYALLGLVEGYNIASVDRITPAQVMILLNATFVIALFLFFLFYSHLKPIDVGVWEPSMVCTIIGYALYFVCGLWLLELLVFMAFYIQQKSPFWSVLTIGIVTFGLLLVSSMYGWTTVKYYSYNNKFVV